jgi:THO complex subunit 3
MVGSVRSVGFSWDGAYVVGGSDEGTGLEIAHVETGDVVVSLGTNAPATCVAWHPGRYWLAYSGDTMGLKIVGAAGGAL